MSRIKNIIVLILAILSAGVPAVFSSDQKYPAVLPIRDRASLTLQIIQARLDQLLPRMMRETGLDMWVILCNEDDFDPVFETMIPYENWCPITQTIVFYDRGQEKGAERLNISRTNMQGLYQDAWDVRAWDKKQKESQWDCLARIIRERNPRKIGINEGDVQWAASGLTSALKKKLVEAIGPQFASRLQSAEPMAVLWLETLLDEEIDLMRQAAALSHAIIAETFSDKVVTPGYTTTDDLRYHYWQRVADLGLKVSFSPFFSIRGRAPANITKYGPGDKVIRPGDLLHCDVGLKYLRYISDHQELAYVLRVGETDAPESLKKGMEQVNRLQDVYAGEFRAGLSGNELLTNILAKARAAGIRNPRVYSHSLGYFLHEPGPLIGLPWEQVNNPGRGEVKLVPNSCFTAEMSAEITVPEWEGKEFRVSLEQDIVFTSRGVFFLDGRQTKFHLIK